MRQVAVVVLLLFGGVSWVLMPLGYIAAGPVAAAAGIRATFVGAAALTIGATALVLLSRDVRTLERRTVSAPAG